MPHSVASPPRTVEPQDCVAQPSAKRCSCPKCDKTIAGGAIVPDGSPLYCNDAGCWTIVRGTYCDHCDHVFAWVETCNERGEPRGLVLSGPGFVRGRKSIDLFLAKHPEARGVN